jgi:hypothetical protein
MNFTVFVRVNAASTDKSSHYGSKPHRHPKKVAIRDDIKTTWQPYVTDRVYQRVKQVLTNSKQDIIDSISVRRTGQVSLMHFYIYSGQRHILK